MQKVLLRFLAYSAAVFLMMVLLIVFATRLPGGLDFDHGVNGTGAHTSEFSPVELLQILLLVFNTGSFIWVAWRDRLRRPMAISMAFVLAACLMRELDFFFDFYIMDNLWQVLIAVLLSFVLVYSVRHRRHLVQGWKRSWPSAGLAMIFSGFILLVPIAQLMGNGALWQEILGDAYIRTVKVAVEELAELGGYAIISMGTVEFLYAWSRLPRKRHRRSARK